MVGGIMKKTVKAKESMKSERGQLGSMRYATVHLAAPLLPCHSVQVQRS